MLGCEGFLSVGVFVFYGDTVYVVVGAEGYDFFVGGDVVDYASADAVDIKVVAVHKGHTAQQEDATADFA